VIVAMSVGQLLGTLSFAAFILVVEISFPSGHLEGWRFASTPSERKERMRSRTPVR
jgi:hypothetical protein